MPRNAAAVDRVTRASRVNWYFFAVGADPGAVMRVIIPPSIRNNIEIRSFVFIFKSIHAIKRVSFDFKNLQQSIKFYYFSTVHHLFSFRKNDPPTLFHHYSSRSAPVSPSLLLQWFLYTCACLVLGMRTQSLGWIIIHQLYTVIIFEGLTHANAHRWTMFDDCIIELLHEKSYCYVFGNENNAFLPHEVECRYNNKWSKFATSTVLAGTVTGA